MSRVSPVGFSTVVSLPCSGQNGSAVRINGGTLIEADSISSNSKEEIEPEVSDTRGKSIKSNAAFCVWMYFLQFEVGAFSQMRQLAFTINVRYDC